MIGFSRKVSSALIKPGEGTVKTAAVISNALQDECNPRIWRLPAFILRSRNLCHF
jgi:hypothetical protein